MEGWKNHSTEYCTSCWHPGRGPASSKGAHSLGLEANSQGENIINQNLEGKKEKNNQRKEEPLDFS